MPHNIAAVAGDQIRLVLAVDDTACVDPVLCVGVEIVAELLAGERPPRHSDEKDLGSDGDIQRLFGVVHEVDVKNVTHLPVVVAPGQLNEAASVVSHAGFRIDLAVFLVLALAVFLDATECAIGFVMCCRQCISEPAIVLLAAVGFPVVENRREAGCRTWFERTAEKVLASIVEKELAIDHIGLRQSFHYWSAILNCKGDARVGFGRGIRFRAGQPGADFGRLRQMAARPRLSKNVPYIRC